jgi:hypothetical protein
MLESELQTCHLLTHGEPNLGRAIIASVTQVEISLQPWEAFRPDGVILFSDILTPLAGMGIDFDIVKGKGPIIADPIRSMEVPNSSNRLCGVPSVVVVSKRLQLRCYTRKPSSHAVISDVIITHVVCMRRTPWICAMLQSAHAAVL